MPSLGYRLGGFCTNVVAKCVNRDSKPAPTAINIVLFGIAAITIPTTPESAALYLYVPISN